MSRARRWPAAPSWSTNTDRTSDETWKFRLHWTMLGRIGLADQGLEVTLVREDARERTTGNTDSGEGIALAITNGADGDNFRIPLADLGREALVEALIHATTDTPRFGGIR